MTDPRLVRFVLAHFFTVIGEWAVTVGVLVHAYGWGGAAAVGLVSLAVLAPALVCAPLAANLTARCRAHRVRLGGFAVQAVAYAGAAVAAHAGAPTPVVAAFVVVGLGAINTLRPTGAVLLPATVRSTRELVSGNLWVSYSDSSSGLIGPLAAAALGGLGGSQAVFTACAAASALALAATAWRPASPAAGGGARGAGGGRGGDSSPPRRVMRAALAEVRARRWTVGVLGVTFARNLVVGAFDVLLIVLALRSLRMDESGPGLLSALVGTGALASTLVVTFVVRRSHLRPALLGALGLTAAICIAIGSHTATVLVLVLLPVLGMCLSAMDNLGRIMLQRSTDPRSLGPLFALLGLVSGAGQLAGAGLAQGLLALTELRVALIGVGAALLLIALASMRSLRSADAHAEVPVVEMSLLGSLPMFGQLPPQALETVARAAHRQGVAAGQTIVAQGDTGDAFYAVADGAFDVVMSGQHVRTARRGDFFGEVALLADVPRTATVTAVGVGELLTIHRAPFLVAITGHEVSHAVALNHVGSLELDDGMLRSDREGADQADPSPAG